jgi:putative phosphoribosyl transferase
MTEKNSDQNLSIKIPLQENYLAGFLHVPLNARGIVLFVHGSGSSHLSVRNQFVAHQLNQAGLATLLFDLLTQAEDKIDARTREFRFDISLLAARLNIATDWLALETATEGLSIGYFGASTGAAAALVTAANLSERISAIVSRGGRPDLAGPALPRVNSPTLLIVGGNDGDVIGMNKSALSELRCPKELIIIPGATHLFEEGNTLEQAADFAKDWFLKFF